MKRVDGSYEVEDLAQGLAALAADILDCSTEEIDLSLEAPAPLAPAVVSLAWDTIEDTTDATSDEADDVTDTQQAPAPERASNGHRPSDVGDEPEDQVTSADLDAEAEAAADFLEGLLDAMDVEGDLRIDVGETVIEIDVVEADSGTLIGRRGQTLESIQEMLRSSMQRQFQRRSRVVVDIEGYRRRRLEKFLEQAEDAIEQVLDGEASVRLEPMDVYERKQVHQLVAAHDGLVSRSHGREPSRRVVIERG